jgi:hypothetical protein
LLVSCRDDEAGGVFFQLQRDARIEKRLVICAGFEQYTQIGPTRPQWRGAAEERHNEWAGLAPELHDPAIGPELYGQYRHQAGEH